MIEKSTLVAYHYFRLPRQQWELMLARMRQLGATTLYTPVPWSVHEFEDNKFDLTGVTNPRRDVVGFVNLCAAMGFNLLLDLTPGPISRANLLHGGVPGWLVHQYPEVRAQNAQGDPLPTYTFAHPTYLKFVSRWFDKISQALSGKQHPAGPVTGAQIAFNIDANLLDHNEHISKVQWPVWLRKRYAEGGVEALNTTYAPTTPYGSISQVSLTDPLTSPAFEQDRQEFIAFLHNHTLDTYTALLQELGWSLSEPIGPPSHGFQVQADPMDVGRSFQWAMGAPVRADGSPRLDFWIRKGKVLATLSADQLPPEVQIIPADGRSITPFESAACYRLLLSGELLAISNESEADEAALKTVTRDELGDTDFYFTLTSPQKPLTGYLDHYLASLLAGQIQTMGRCARLARQLAAALKSTPQPTTATPSGPSLTEAQHSLAEAELALRKAAASIEALEEAFVTALNKPQLVIETPLLLSIDGTKFGPVREACQAVAEQLSAAAATNVASSLTVAQYQATYQQVITAADEARATLAVQLQWLREQLVSSVLPASARSVHHYVEILLQSLTQGVLRV